MNVDGAVVLRSAFYDPGVTKDDRETQKVNRHEHGDAHEAFEQNNSARQKDNQRRPSVPYIAGPPLIIRLIRPNHDEKDGNNERDPNVQQGRLIEVIVTQDTNCD